MVEEDGWVFFIVWSNDGNSQRFAADKDFVIDKGFVFFTRNGNPCFVYNVNYVSEIEID